jgi:hypothetical protein
VRRSLPDELRETRLVEVLYAVALVWKLRM